MVFLDALRQSLAIQLMRRPRHWNHCDDSDDDDDDEADDDDKGTLFNIQIKVRAELKGKRCDDASKKGAAFLASTPSKIWNTVKTKKERKKERKKEKKKERKKERKKEGKKGRKKKRKKKRKQREEKFLKQMGKNYLQTKI